MANSPDLIGTKGTKRDHIVIEAENAVITTSRLLTEMTHLVARAYLKKSSNYVNFELPPYINFDQLITLSSAIVTGRQLADICRKDEKGKPIYPSGFDDVNYTILSNKDGAYSWRPMQIIHPVLYVELVNLITSKENWASLQAKFLEFSDSDVECISIPRESRNEESDRAWQVTNWWESIEQETIKQSLRYSYLATTDITDCYGSIYTHSFEWALDEGGRPGAKERKKARLKSSGLGAAIDGRLQNLNSAQTNGIPQGSTLMDFLAEIVLGYADLQLTDRLKRVDCPRESYRILRYRDDYRILADNPVIGSEILKQIDLVLYELGLKMSPSKTKTSSDVITSAIKEEKMESIYLAPGYLHFQKRALRIYQLSKKYPNSGLVSKELGAFYDDFVRPKKTSHVNHEVLIAIFVMIGVNSPKTIHLVAGIVSKLLEKIDDTVRIRSIVRDVIKKFGNIPNSGLLDIWLQRISEPLGLDHEYKDRFTKVALKQVPNSSLWNNEWLSDDGVGNIDAAEITTLAAKLETESISYVIEREEFELYRIADY